MLLREIARAMRVPVSLRARLDAGAETLDVDIVSLSVSGAFVEMMRPDRLSKGQPVTVEIPLPGGDPMRVPASVVRLGWCAKQLRSAVVDELVIRIEGVGLEFEELPDEEAERLQDFLDLIQDR